MVRCVTVHLRQADMRDPAGMVRTLAMHEDMLVSNKTLLAKNVTWGYLVGVTSRGAIWLVLRHMGLFGWCYVTWGYLVDVVSRGAI
jgi:hypothetical protein